LYSIEDIRKAHLEVTSRCNASCPQCARNANSDRPNPKLPIAELFLDDIEQIFTEDLVRQLEYIYLCGNYGDAVMAHDTIPIYRHLRDIYPGIELRLVTNGGARDERSTRPLKSPTAWAFANST